MAGNRTSSERVSKLKHPEELADVRDYDRFKVSDVHDRLGTILSDQRDGTERHLAEYNETLDVEFYPTAPTKVPSAILGQQLTVAAPAAEISRPATNDYEYDVYGIYIVASALAANRDINVSLYDGTRLIPIYDSGAPPNWASGEDFLVWPVDLSTYMTGAIAVIGQAPLKFNRTMYLYGTATGLAGVETFDIYLAAIARPFGTGLRP
jgi:hypothetical protein